METKKALDYLSKIAPTKSTLPILRNVLVEACNGYTKLTATNLEATLTLQVDAKMVKGSTTVNLRELRKVIRSYNVFELTPMGLKIGDYILETMPAEDFPRIHQAVVPGVLADTDYLRQALERVKHSASKEEYHLVLHGILVAKNEVVAADGYRMAIQQIQTPFQGLYDAKLLPLVLAPFVTAQFSQDDKFLYITADEGYASMRPIEGIFPNYKQVIPDDFNFIFTLDANTLASALPVVIKDNPILTLHFHDGQLDLSRNDFKKTIQSIEDGEIKIGFYQVYLAEMLKEMKERVEVKLVSPTSITLWVDGDSDYQEALMPVYIG